MDKALSNLMEQIATAAAPPAAQNNTQPSKAPSVHELHARLLEIPGKVYALLDKNDSNVNKDCEPLLRSLDKMPQYGADNYLALLHTHFSAAHDCISITRDACENALRRDQSTLQDAKTDLNRLEDRGVLIYEHRPHLVPAFERMTSLLEEIKGICSKNIVQWHTIRTHLDRLSEEVLELQRQLHYDPQQAEIVSRAVKEKYAALRRAANPEPASH